MKILIQIIKIASISLLFAIIFNFASAYLSEGTKTIPSELNEIENISSEGNNNKYKFKKSNTKILSNVGVALTTNVGIKYKQRGNQDLYKNIPQIGKTISNKKFSDNKNLSRHILILSEYYNVLKTDIKGMLDSSYNKKETLDAYISQLEYRYKSTIIEMQSLVKKKAELSASMSASSEKINSIKIKIDKDFRAFNADKTDNNIQKLLEERANYDYARTHIIFVNQYIKQYLNLNNSNKILLNTLITNKDAIVRNTKIVIPNTGIATLKKLNLIIEEKDYKSE